MFGNWRDRALNAGIGIDQAAFARRLAEICHVDRAVKKPGKARAKDAMAVEDDDRAVIGKGWDRGVAPIAERSIRSEWLFGDRGHVLK